MSGMMIFIINLEILKNLILEYFDFLNQPF